MVETFKLYILMTVWMTLHIIQGLGCMKNQNFCAHFLLNFLKYLDEIQVVATTSWFVEAHANLLCRIIFQGRELYMIL